MSTIEKYILRIKLANAPMGRLSQLLYLFQIGKLSEKSYFIIENFFPRKEVMRQIFPNHTRNHSPQEYFLRILDIFGSGCLDIYAGIKAILKGSLPKI